MGDETSWVERALSARPEMDGGFGGTRASLKWGLRWSVFYLRRITLGPKDEERMDWKGHK